MVNGHALKSQGHLILFAACVYDWTTTGCAKNGPICFCQNFVKSPLNLIIFGTQIAKTIEIC